MEKMDEHTSHELAYKKGYEKGKQDAIPKGRWELEEYQTSTFGVDQSFRCSNCRTWADDDDHLTPFCPYCGADLRDPPKGE